MLNVINSSSGRIIFMGTSDFSVISLEELLKNKYNVVGIVTITDRFSIRNKNIFIESAVKKYARLYALPILQSDDLNHCFFLATLQKWHTEIIIIVAFRLLPKAVWELPIFGSFNLHPSLLPNYRGAAPIQWTIMNGDSETGVTTFKVNKIVDMGKMLLQKKISLEKEENTGSLSIRLSEIGAYLVIDTYKCIVYNCIVPKEQITNFKLKMAPKLLGFCSKINCKATLKEIYNKIRGLSPFPGAWCIFNEKEFKIYRAYNIFDNHSRNIGILENNIILFRIGYLLILECKLEGKHPILKKTL